MIVKDGNEIASLIIQERRRQNYPIKELSEKSGIPLTTINCILYRPELTPGIKTCLPILHALGLEMLIVRRKSDGQAR